MPAAPRRSTYRQLQAQQTKDRIVAAARVLMTERGWSGTSVEAIAQHAGVATQTIYAAFGNKRSILTGMREVMRRDSQIPELMAAAAEAPAARDRLRLWAKLIRQQMETSYDVISIHRQAAKSDPKVKADYRKVLDDRAKTFEVFIEGLEAALSPTITPRIATDLLWAFSNEELYQELVGERGWTDDHFEEWLAATLVQQLLGSARRPARASSAAHGRRKTAD